MNVYVYLDESGSIHKNSNTRYFAVGGYVTFDNDKNRIKSRYKKLNKIIKEENGISIDSEVKSFDMSQEQKISIFNEIQDIETFYGLAKIFDKSKMRKSIVHSNMFFNYAVKLLIKDCVLKTLDLPNDEQIDFIMSIDNRNISVGQLHDLQTYLNTEFCLYNYRFNVRYYDSASNFCIQLADLIVNTFYNSQKDESLVIDVLRELKRKNFKVSIFPGERSVNNFKE